MDVTCIVVWGKIEKNDNTKTFAALLVNIHRAWNFNRNNIWNMGSEDGSGVSPSLIAVCSFPTNTITNISHPKLTVDHYTHEDGELVRQFAADS